MTSDEFRPAWWLPGPHGQTLGARLLRASRGIRFRRERLELDDGDFLDLDWVHRTEASSREDTAPLVLVLHGLEGCAQSTYALEAYRALARRGIAAVGMNFRSCSGEPNRLPRMYHSGETGDLRTVLKILHARQGSRALGALGFSLGGNVLLKYLGERRGEPRPGGSGGTSGRGGREPVATLQAAAAISVPFDLSAGADHLERGFARVYRHYLVRRLQAKVRAKAAILEPHLDIDRVLRARSFREFDEAATAVLHGFAGAEDYYQQSSSARYLAGIRVPTLIIHAKDDPFLPPAAIPPELARRNGEVRVLLSARGGHVGFVAGPPWAPVFWAEQTAAAFLASRLGGAVSSAE